VKQSIIQQQVCTDNNKLLVWKVTMCTSANCLYFWSCTGLHFFAYRFTSILLTS